MRIVVRTILACVVSVGVGQGVADSSARAQDPGLGGLLGGYGAMSGGSGSAMSGGYSVIDPTGMGGGVLVPVGGRSGAPVSSRMGGGGGLSFMARPTSVMTYSRPSFTMGSMGGGMRSMSGGMGQSFGRRSFSLQGMGLSGGMTGGGMSRMPAGGGMGVMPPSLGYPFRQPPSLLSPSSSGTGMSM